MTRYQPTEPCQKCGSVAKDVQFRRAPPNSPSAPELLGVSCRTCGYEEFRLPLDAKVVQPVDHSTPEHNEC